MKKRVYPERSRRAFTLIELMVTISIMALLAVTAVPAFSRISAVNQLDNAAEEVKQMILEAQSLAMNPQKQQLAKVSVWRPRYGDLGITYHYSDPNQPEEIIKPYTLSSVLSYTRKDGTPATSFGLVFLVPTGAIDSFYPLNLSDSSTFVVSITSSKLETNNIRYIKVDKNTGKIWVTKIP